jgi:hypothetical protein
MKTILLLSFFLSLHQGIFCSYKLLSDKALVQYYSFEKNDAGRVFDQSQSQMNGIMNNIVITDGKVAKCAEFNNTDSYIHSGILPQHNSFTGMAWINPNAYGNENNTNILIFENTESYYMNIMCKTTGNRTKGKMRVGLQRASGGWEYLDSPDLIPLNTWTHAAFTFDGVNLCLYINGNLVASKQVVL